MRRISCACERTVSKGSTLLNRGESDCRKVQDIGQDFANMPVAPAVRLLVLFVKER